MPTHQIAVPHLPRPTLAKLIERHRKTILPAEVVKTFRECDVELDHLLTIVGNNHSVRVREKRRADLNRVMQAPSAEESKRFLESAWHHFTDNQQIVNAAKNAASLLFAEKVAPRLVEVFERVAALLRAEAQAEADAMRARAERWDVANATACPLAATLRNEAEHLDVQVEYSRKVAAGREVIMTPPKPSDVLRPTLGIVL